MIDDLDRKYMRLCFELAEKGAGYVAPNPLVGALIVKNGRIISTGYHKKYGSAHAEINAINSADENLEGTTLYCSLEPCVHTGKKTPPCVPAIITCGITKVVISNVDPNPKVSGNGIEKLRNAGVEVVTGVLDEDGKELNRFFFKYMERGMPYVTVKIAQSGDGKITSSKGTRTRLTGIKSQIFVHKLRGTFDAVLVGAKTVNIDDPELTVRKTGGRNPVRIILDGNLNSNPAAKVFNDGKSRTLIFCSRYIENREKSEFARKKTELIELESGEGNQLALTGVLKELADLKITSLLVEGGGEIFSQFVSRELCDEVIVLKAPVELNGGIEAISIGDRNNFILSKTELLDEDLMLTYRLKTADYVHRNN